MKTIILAAGEGTRLRPYTLDRPKCLVEIDGISLIDRQISVLHSNSNSPITIVGGYHAEMLINKGDNLIINPKFQNTNMVWSLFCAEDELKGDILVSYGDIVYSRKILKAILASDSDISVAIDLNWEKYWKMRNDQPINDVETLKMNNSGCIIEIGQKPTSLEQIQGQYMGLIKFSQKGLDVMKSAFKNAIKYGDLSGIDIKKAYMTDMLQYIIDEGHPIQAVKVTDDWVEVDTVSDLKSKVTLDRVTRISEEISSFT
jgi:choline kinase